jgi:hypothetical protein
MTKVNNYQIQANGEALGKAIKNYRKPTGPRTMGMEMERFLLKRDGKLPDRHDHNALYLALCKVLHEKASVEPGSHMIEIKTGVHEHADSLVQELLMNLDILKTEARKIGLVVTPTSDLPGFPVTQLSGNLISRIDPETGKTRRVWEMMKAYEQNGWTDVANWGCGTTSIQLTHSVDDADTLHRWARVHAALSPLYFAVFENRSRSSQGLHEGIRLRRLMNERGLVADYVFKARNGVDFVDRYIEFILTNQLLTILDEKGQDIALARPTAFNDLPVADQTLGTLLQSASFYWNVCKIKLILDERRLQTGEIKLENLLLEVRDMDVSDAAVPAIAGWFSTLTESETSLFEVEARLESIGIPVCSDPALAEKRTRDALTAVENDPRYLETVFGDADQGTILRDAITQIILPMLRNSGDPAHAIPSWEEAATSKVPPFRAIALPAAPGPSNAGPALS